MITLSLCMIVKNEEDVLKRCLSSIQDVVDEIIIVDTGSTDATKDIAASFTSLIYDFSWIDDFSKARNFAFAHASKQYCMWMDADDVITEEDKTKMLSLKQHMSLDTDIVMMKYHTAYDSEGKPTFSYFRERWIRNSPAYRWKGAVHEVIEPSGKIIYENIAVSHKKLHVFDGDRNIRILKKQKVQKGLNPREQYYYARELYYHHQYQEAIEEFTCFLKDGLGWIENNIDACRIKGHCYMALKQEKQAMHSYFESFYYDAPRGEICCDIAHYFFHCKKYQQAIYWYQAAASLTPDETSGAFIEKDCYGFIPYLQLCVCYDRLQQKDTAIHYNELAGRLKPNDPRYLYNKEYYNNSTNA